MTDAGPIYRDDEHITIEMMEADILRLKALQAEATADPVTEDRDYTWQLATAIDSVRSRIKRRHEDDRHAALQAQIDELRARLDELERRSSEAADG